MATSTACHFTSCVKMNGSMLMSITRLTGNCLNLCILKTTCDLHVPLFIYAPLNNCSQIPAAPCICKNVRVWFLIVSFFRKSDPCIENALSFGCVKAFQATINGQN